MRITKEQGFPLELDYGKHCAKTFTASDFSEKIFIFTNKPTIRMYKAPPVRNFLVEDIDGKWLYWGLIQITEITHDYVNKITSGKFKIIYIYSPEEMKQAQSIIDRDTETDYLT